MDHFRIDYTFVHASPTTLVGEVRELADRGGYDVALVFDPVKDTPTRVIEIKGLAGVSPDQRLSELTVGDDVSVSDITATDLPGFERPPIVYTAGNYFVIADRFRAAVSAITTTGTRNPTDVKTLSTQLVLDVIKRTALAFSDTDLPGLKEPLDPVEITYTCPRNHTIRQLSTDANRTCPECQLPIYR